MFYKPRQFERSPQFLRNEKESPKIQAYPQRKGENLHVNVLIYYIHGWTIAELVHNEKVHFDWFPGRSRFCYGGAATPMWTTDIIMAYRHRLIPLNWLAFLKSKCS